MPEQPDVPALTFVDAAEAVGPSLGHLDAEVVGVDVERADADRYFRRAALVQVGVPGACVLLDGEVLDELPALDDFLGPERLAVLHAVENDLEPLAAKGVRPTRFADTAIAASLLGLPTGLGGLLDEVLDVSLDGDKSAYQRADWAARPLSEGMAAYAAGDVVHLPRLWGELAGRLEDTGRGEWYEQELAWTVTRAAEDARDWRRVKGAGRLSPAQRAVLRGVWEERERLAREHDIAPNRLLHDDVLREVAADPPRTEAQLVRRSQRRRSLLRRHAADLLAAIDRGADAPPEPKEGSGRRWSDVDRDIYDALRRRRAEVAADLGLDAGVLCPSRPLWAAVVGDPADGHELCELADLRPWQATLLAEPLWDVYTSMRRAGDEAAPATAGDLDLDVSAS